MAPLDKFGISPIFPSLLGVERYEPLETSKKQAEARTLSSRQTPRINRRSRYCHMPITGDMRMRTWM